MARKHKSSRIVGLKPAQEKEVGQLVQKPEKLQERKPSPLLPKGYAVTVKDPLGSFSEQTGATF